MEKIKKILHYLSSMLLYALLMILFVVVLMVVITIGDRAIALKNHQSKAPLFSAYVIISPSMVPNINVYDAVITARVPQNRIGMYDIITFLSKEIDTHGVPITHRVVGILKMEDGERAYRTKGDNNNKEDKAIILQSEVIGKVLFRIPMLGYVRTFVTSKIGFLISVVLPIITSLFLEIWRLIHRRKEKLKEKQQQNQKMSLSDTMSEANLSTESLANVESVSPVAIVSSPVGEISTLSPTISLSPTNSQVSGPSPILTSPLSTETPQVVTSQNSVVVNPAPVVSTSPSTSVVQQPGVSQNSFKESPKVMDSKTSTSAQVNPPPISTTPPVTDEEEIELLTDDDDVEVI